MQHRFLDTLKARWISEDPIGFDGRDYNLYRYVGCNPINYTDPRGMIGDWCGLAYGNCCVSLRRSNCNGSVPTTVGEYCVDKACCRYDCCLLTFNNVAENWNKCQQQLCDDVENCYSSCSKSKHGATTCRFVRLQVMAWACLAQLPNPNYDPYP